jgi:hypothetical protein
MGSVLTSTVGMGAVNVFAGLEPADAVVVVVRERTGAAVAVVVMGCATAVAGAVIVEVAS